MLAEQQKVVSIVLWGLISQIWVNFGVFLPKLRYFTIRFVLIHDKMFWESLL